MHDSLSESGDELPDLLKTGIHRPFLLAELVVQLSTCRPCCHSCATVIKCLTGLCH